MNALMWAFSCSVWVYVAVKVARRMCAQRAGLAQAQTLREFANLVARDSMAGAQPTEAIRIAAQACELPRFVAATHHVELGGPIPDDGAPEQRHFLALWRVAGRHGLSLGELADTHVCDIDAQLERHRSTSAAMAGARLTVLVLLALPVGAVVLGQTMGLGTVHFYATSVLGGLLLLLGSVLGAGGVLWTEQLSASVLGGMELGGVGRRAGPHSPLDAARLLDLVAAALRTGAPLAQAWEIGMDCMAVYAEEDPHQQARVVPSLVALGAGAHAWDGLLAHPHLGTIARQAAQHTRSGAMLAQSMSHHARHLRALATAQATEAAEKMLVILAAPLTLCFLPAFVLTGLVPLAIGLAGL